MGKLKDLFYKFYFRKYVNNNPNQLKTINELKSTPKTFLVISNTAFGDTLLSTSAIKSLKKSFPESKIIALLNHNIITLFKDYKYIDEIIPFYGGYKRLFSTIKEIKKYKPSMALIFHGNGPQDIYISVLSGCNFILKHPNNSPLKKYLSFDFEKKQQHTIEDRVDLVRIIGGKNIYTQMNLVQFDNEIFIEKYKYFQNTIGFQIGAADVYKMWPIENFIDLTKKIISLDNQTKIVITGIKQEYSLAQKIVEECGDNIINMCGECSIEELPYLVQNFKVLITNDTGTMHLAIALQRPTISLFSPTTSIGIGPYQDLDIHKVIQKDGSYIQKLPKKKRSDEAMKLISVDEVFETYNNIRYGK